MNCTLNNIYKKHMVIIKYSCFNWMYSTKAKDELSKIGVKYGVLELDVS